MSAITIMNEQPPSDYALFIDGYENIFLAEDINLWGPFTYTIVAFFDASSCEYVNRKGANMRTSAYSISYKRTN